MLTLLYFILAISILVVIHEYGHFWVARRCGVRVLRFSVGFGKPLWSFRDRQGTEFAIAPIPLGGYVSMLDEREAPVPEALLDQAFNRKTPLQRMAIAVAGPVANFMFAVLAYWVLLVAGTTGLVPVVGSVSDGSLAAEAGIRAGDEIIAVAGQPTPTWEDVNWQLIGFIGEDVELALQVRSADGAVRDYHLPVSRWLADAEQPDPVGALGLRVRQVPLPAVIGQVLPEGAAERAGLQAGDHILSVNGETAADWYAWVEQIQSSPGEPLQLTLVRAGVRLTLTLTPDARTDEQGNRRGFVGASVQVPQYPPEWLRTRHAGVLEGLWQGLLKTADTVRFTLDSLWKMLLGELSVKNLSGPVTIAKVAGASAAGGLESFIGFLALLSVSLGVLNLLPVPVLDGGHIVFCAAEMLRGKPLSESVQMLAVKVGMFLLLSLMLVAFYNDISRL